MGRATDVDVLVVGAGPTGLTLASELLRHGLTVRIVDASAAIDPHSRAIAIHARTLEIFDALGIGGAFVERGKKLVGATIWAQGPDPVARIDFDLLDSRHRYVLTVSQAVTEELLAGLVATRGGSVERAMRVTSFRQDGTGVTAQLVDSNGSPSECRAAWLVGCDGARSTVRKALALPFGGETYDETFYLADTQIAWDVRDDRVSTWFTETGFIACFPMADGRHRIVATAPEREGDAPAPDPNARPAPPTLEELESMLRTASGMTPTLSDATWLATFRAHCRQVAHYRDDRVLLAGDAAHVHSPAGGQGMNMGIQDAHNLAWKLSLVHHGHARDRLLDTYEAERHLVGRNILASTDAATRAATVKSGVARGARNQLARFLTSFEAIQQRVSAEVAELSISYVASPIVREDTTGLLQARIGTVAGADTPTMTTIREFAAGPKPGARAPDGRVTVAGEGGTRRLLESIDTRKHTVVLFDGRSDSAEGYERFASIIAKLAERHADVVDVRVVTPRASRPSELEKNVVVLLDPDAELERAYAAASECCYVIRPDLVIGYRSQPADEDKVLAWLSTVFR